jgi:hypothetical protein
LKIAEYNVQADINKDNYVVWEVIVSLAGQRYNTYDLEGTIRLDKLELLKQLLGKNHHSIYPF